MDDAEMAMKCDCRRCGPVDYEDIGDNRSIKAARLWCARQISLTLVAVASVSFGVSRRWGRGKSGVALCRERL